MNPIIVPTDFSAAADAACIYAARLAQRTQSSICLVHVYQLPISVSDVPVLMVSADELRSGAEVKMEELVKKLGILAPGVSVRTECRLGDVTDEVSDLAKEIKPSLVVVGKHGSTGVERLLFGSTALSLIRHAHLPVLAVPQEFAERNIAHIVLAADGAIPPQAAGIISELAAATSAQLHVVHVDKEESYLEQQPALVHLRPVYENVHHESFAEGIQQYLHTHQADLLVMLPHKHSFMERMFSKLHTPEVMNKTNVPVLCIPE